MPNYPAHRTTTRSAVDMGHSRQLQRALDTVAGQADLAVARVEAATEEAVAVVQAHNALGATAAHADAIFSGMLSALPITDNTDPDFRAQLKQATRARVITTVWQFNP